MRLLHDANYDNYARGWVVNLLFGPGAGYIGGSTVFVAWKSGSLHWSLRHRGGDFSKNCSASPWRAGYFRLGKLEFGWTRNANLVPYTAH